MFLKKLCNYKTFPSVNNINYGLSFINNYSLATFATKMRAGVTKNKKDSAGRRLGIKKYGGEEIRENEIILRQRGFKWKAGENVHFGKDQTLHASKEGKITFSRDPWSRRRKVLVNVIEQEIPNRKLVLPRPFMYHPELYPELAKNNIKLEPLVVQCDINRQLKAEETNKKNQLKMKNPEIRLVKRQALTPKNKSDVSLRNKMLISAKNSNKLNPEMYSSKFEIEPIFKEMEVLANQYFIPNIKLENKKYLEKLTYAEKAQENQMTPFPRGIYQTEELIYGESSSLNNYSSVAELYASFVKNNRPVSLRETMIEMKKNNQLEPNCDLRTIPTEVNETKIYADERIELKIELEELVSKLDTLKEEEVKELQEDMGVDSKEELKQLIEDKLVRLNSEITLKYLNLSSLSDETQPITTSASK